MRIIAGDWRGRTIEAPSGQATRPTADRVRETVFSMLLSRLGSFEDLRVADLFAGSGALGLEALSRGAASATFVETDQRASAIIRSNADRLGASDRVRLLTNSATALPPSEGFDVIFADPPYGQGLGPQVLEAVSAADWLAPGGWISIETARGERIIEPSALECDAERDVGSARITLLRRP